MPNSSGSGWLFLWDDIGDATFSGDQPCQMIFQLPNIPVWKSTLWEAFSCSVVHSCKTILTVPTALSSCAWTTNISTSATYEDKMTTGSRYAGEAAPWCLQSAFQQGSSVCAVTGLTCSCPEFPSVELQNHTTAVVASVCQVGVKMSESRPRANPRVPPNSL